MACDLLAKEYAASVEWLRDRLGSTDGTSSMQYSATSCSGLVKQEHSSLGSNTPDPTTVDLWAPWHREEPDDWNAAKALIDLPSPDRGLVRRVDGCRLRLSSNRRIQRMENDPMDESMVGWKSNATQEEGVSDSEDEERAYDNLVELLATRSLPPSQSSKLCFLGCSHRSVGCSSTHCAVSGIYLHDLGEYRSDGCFYFFNDDDIESSLVSTQEQDWESDEPYVCEHEGYFSDDEYH